MTIAKRKMTKAWPYERKSCLEWQGSLDKDGYGRTSKDGVDAKAHRAFYEAWYGKKLSSDTVLLHSCDNPKCFNPHHLSEGSQLDNVRDMDSKGRRVAHKALVTHCPRGHEYTPENTIVYRDGKRRCKTCRSLKR